MYSLILMTAMAGSTDTASFGWRTGCGGGCYASAAVGCSGYSCSGYGSSCSGYSCGGCSGYACNGCTGCSGGPMFPRARAVLGVIVRPFARLAGAGSSCSGYSCNGCSGYSCSGYSCNGCSGYSCHGSAYMNSSCYGSCSGCHGGVIYAGSSAYGGCYGSSFPGGGCSGTIIHGASYPSMSGSTSYTPTIISETVVPATGTPMVSPPADKPKDTDKPKTSLDAAAHLALTLPADAKLFVDGQLIGGQGERRQFHTPELVAGQAYYYEFQAEFEINGKRETETKRVVVRAGESLTASFPKLIAAAKTAVAPTVVVSR